MNRIITTIAWQAQAGSGITTTGMYEHRQGTTTKIIDSSESIDNKAIFKFWPQSIDNSVLAFVADFVDGSCGIYTVNLNGN